jgi:hypothetical protein
MIFPLYFEAAPVTVSATNNDYIATSSLVFLGSGVGITLKDAEDVGTTVTFYCTTSTTDATVTLGTKVSDSYDLITLAGNLSSATVMWTPNGWNVISISGETTLS